MFQFNDKQFDCPFDCFIEIIKGKWRTSILLALSHGPRRFSELEKDLDGITAKVLRDNLKVFEDNQLLQRHVYATVPPKVEYTLTEEGWALLRVMEQINQWVSENRII